jgi:hypothetical protein
MNRLLNPAPRFNEWSHSCYGLWSGDGMVPPEFLGESFDGSHTHYLTSGSAAIDSQDIEVMIGQPYPPRPDVPTAAASLC